MNECCDNNCNQGRDCPSKVAPIKCSYPRDENNYSDEYLRMVAIHTIANKIALIFCLLIIFFGFIGALMFIVN